MTLFTPGIVKIKGKQCLIIADSVSHELPSSGTVLLEQVGAFNIFCLAAELIEKKAAYRNMPVYGYWQTLYASKKWQPDMAGISAYQHDNNGQYVAVDLDEKTAITGEIVNGRAVAVAGEQFNQDQIQWLEVTVDEITLPSRVAMTMAEQIATRERKNKNRLLAASFIVLALIGGIISGSWFAELELKHLKSQRAALMTEIDTVQAAITELKAHKLATVPNQQEILELLEALSWVEGIEIPNSNINTIQLSVPYQSYMDMIYILAQHDIPYTERWLPSGQVQVSLR